MKYLIQKIVITAFLLTQASYASAENLAEKDAIKIVTNLIGKCETEGMLACKPYMKGIDFVFAYLKANKETQYIENQLASFIEKRYPNNKSEFEIGILNASAKFSVEINFTPNQFINRITKVNKVPDGYDIILDENIKLLLRKENNNWVAVFPPSLEKGFIKKFLPFYRAVKLKRVILIYRMMESEVTNISKKEFESNLNSDIAPIVVAFLPEEKTPLLLKWLSKDINEVFKFYKAMPTIRDMQANIKKVHGL